MREIQARNERPNLGAEKAIRTPLLMASAMSVILSLKMEPRR